MGSKFLGNMWLSGCASPNVFDLIFKSQSKARQVITCAWVFAQLTNQAAKAKQLTNEKITEYVNQYKNEKANGEVISMNRMV